MTKYPLVFLNGPRSLFFYEKLGGSLQDYIQAHGYQVLYPSLSFRNKKLRILQLNEFLKKQNSEQFHFVAGPKTQLEFKEVLAQYPLSTITNPEDFTISIDPNINISLSYKLHMFFCHLNQTEAENYLATFPIKNVVLYERFLDRCIDLAENEVYA